MSAANGGGGWRRDKLHQSLRSWWGLVERSDRERLLSADYSMEKQLALLVGAAGDEIRLKGTGSPQRLALELAFCLLAEVGLGGAFDDHFEHVLAKLLGAVGLLRRSGNRDGEEQVRVVGAISLCRRGRSNRRTDSATGGRTGAGPGRCCACRRIHRAAIPSARRPPARSVCLRCIRGPGQAGDSS